VWGRVKSGKTRYIATGPNPIVFAVEEGTKTIKNYPGLDVFPINEKGYYVTPKWDHASKFVYYLNYADHNYKTVGVDTMSALLRVAMRHINKDEEVRDEFRAKGTTDRRTWGRVGSLMNDFMEDLEAVCKTRGMHLIYTCQERVLDEDNAEQAGSYYVPDLPPSVRSTILEKPDVISRSFIEETEESTEEDVKLRYGQIFKHPDWPVGVRETEGMKPLPSQSFKVTIPILAKRLGASVQE
jgi:hypothetical protein